MNVNMLIGILAFAVGAGVVAVAAAATATTAADEGGPSTLLIDGGGASDSGMRTLGTGSGEAGAD